MLVDPNVLITTWSYFIMRVAIKTSWWANNQYGIGDAVDEEIDKGVDVGDRLKEQSTFISIFRTNTDMFTNIINDVKVWKRSHSAISVGARRTSTRWKGFRMFRTKRNHRNKARGEPETLTGVCVNYVYSWPRWRQSTWPFSFESVIQCGRNGGSPLIWIIYLYLCYQI